MRVLLPSLMLLFLGAGLVSCTKSASLLGHSLNPQLLEPRKSKGGRGLSQEAASDDAVCLGRFRLAMLGVATTVPSRCFFQPAPYQPHPLAGILETMLPAPAALTEAQLTQGRLLSLGEGTPSLLNYLLSGGVDAYGLDLEDHRAEVSAGQEHRYIVANATQFAREPFAVGGFRHMVSVMLFCCMGVDPSLQSLEEQLGLLQVGGTLRHAMWDHEGIREGDGSLSRLIQGIQALAERHRSEYRLRLGLYFMQPRRTDSFAEGLPGVLLLVAKKLPAVAP